jgi:diaminohydroxyphosphoribosylaminopyrimidine deaminase/5-amino-6-(5-phosphoribosylamino)uracil reductase
MEKMRTLQDMGLNVIVVASKNGHVDLEDLLKKLAEREITSILVEGGARLNAALLEAGLVDKIVVFYAPKVIGGQDSPGFVGGAGIERLADAYSFEISRVERVGEDIMVTAYPKKGSGASG